MAHERQASGANYLRDLPDSLRKGVQRAPRLLLGRVGLHRPLMSQASDRAFDEGAIGQQPSVMRHVRAFLEAHQVPRRLIDTMMARNSLEVYWLTAEDLSEMDNFSPAYEELVIHHCGRSPSLMKPFRRTVDAGDTETALAMLATLEVDAERLNECTGRVNARLRADVVKPLLARLREGWRPWLDPVAR